MLELHHISKSFNGVSAVRDVSLALHPGRVTAIIGPNGAGKSTLLRIACGLLTPDSGSVLLDGRPIDEYGSKLYRSVSVVLEDSSLAYMDLGGWVNLEYQGALYGLSRRQVRERTGRLLDILDLRRHMDKNVGDWSRGTQQKLALVAALIPSPRVLLLDESTLGLDVVAKRDFLNIVADAVQHDVAVLITSHQLEVLEQFTDDVVLIKRGSMLFSGTFEQFGTKFAPESGGKPGLEQILIRIFDDGSDAADISDEVSTVPDQAQAQTADMGADVSGQGSRQ